jgi:hypothetical protein
MIPTQAPWREQWERSQRIQSRLREQLDAEVQRGQAILAANTTTAQRARDEYDRCLETRESH